MKNCILKNALWILTTLSLTLCSCEKQKPTTETFEKTFNLSSFNRVYAGETFNIIINKGAEFNVTARGEESYVNHLQFTVSNNILTVSFDNSIAYPTVVDIAITVPLLVSINLAGGSRGTIRGFGGQPTVLRAVLSGRSQATIIGTGINTNVEVGGLSSLTITGNTENLYGQISADGRLNAYGLLSTETDLSLTGTAKAYVLVQNALFGSASDESRLYYKGNPSTTHFETYGNGSIIHD
jgi:hypothetical protein